jgi:hypothetical protein
MELANAMRSAMERNRDERRADLRDALAVLNADQQARAWELRDNVGRAPRARAVGRAVRRGDATGPGARRGQLRRGMPAPGQRRPL